MVNYFAILVATVAAFAVGMLWYTVLFGKIWRKEMGIMEGGSMSGMAKSMIGGFIATLVMVYVLALLFVSYGVTAIQTASNSDQPFTPLVFAFLIWLGFVATIQSNSIWYEKKSWMLYFINVAHYLVAVLVAAAVLVWLS